MAMNFLQDYDKLRFFSVTSLAINMARIGKMESRGAPKQPRCETRAIPAITEVNFSAHHKKSPT
jgi:hypothetical protein